jgi:hypothetical protein
MLCGAHPFALAKQPYIWTEKNTEPACSLSVLTACLNSMCCTVVMHDSTTWHSQQTRRKDTHMAGADRHNGLSTRCRLACNTAQRHSHLCDCGYTHNSMCSQNTHPEQQLSTAHCCFQSPKATHNATVLAAHFDSMMQCSRLQQSGTATGPKSHKSQQKHVMWQVPSFVLYLPWSSNFTPLAMQQHNCPAVDKGIPYPAQAAKATNSPLCSGCNCTCVYKAAICHSHCCAHTQLSRRTKASTQTALCSDAVLDQQGLTNFATWHACCMFLGCLCQCQVDSKLAETTACQYRANPTGAPSAQQRAIETGLQEASPRCNGGRLKTCIVHGETHTGVATGQATQMSLSV